MQVNNSPRFIKSFMIGLIASSTGAFLALPGTAMPEPGKAASVVEETTEAVEAAPAEAAAGAIAEPTAEETLPVANAVEAAIDDAATAAEEAVDTAGEAVEAAANDTEEAVVDADETVEEAIADTEITETAPVAEADAFMEVTPVAETDMTEDVVEADAMTDEEQVAEEDSVEASENVATEEMDTESFTIAELTSLNDSFKTLSAALEAAELGEVLGSEGPFTVFAPTDEAFADLPEGMVEQLLLPENKAVLTQILTYHVVPGAVLSTELETGNVATVEGSDLTVDVADTVTVNNAKVLQADVAASNGVIHVIDRVIVPLAPEADADIEGTETVQ